MYLIVGISLITLLLNFYHVLLKFFSVSVCFYKIEEDATVLKEIERLKRDLQEFNDNELDSYTRKIREMRVENKIEGLREKLKAKKDYNKLKQAFVQRILGYVVKAIFLIVLAIISIKYRYTPLVVFDERFNFAPFSGIVMFPTGIKNSISVPFWVLSCNLTFRWFRNLCEGK